MSKIKIYNGTGLSGQIKAYPEIKKVYPDIEQYTVHEPENGTQFTHLIIAVDAQARKVTINAWIDRSGEELFYIKSPYRSHGNCVEWWAEDAKGYTANLDLAWKVSKEEAARICTMKRGDQAYPVESIDAMARRHFDFQDFDRVLEIQFIVPAQTKENSQQTDNTSVRPADKE